MSNDAHRSAGQPSTADAIAHQRAHPRCEECGAPAANVVRAGDGLRSLCARCRAATRERSPSPTTKKSTRAKSTRKRTKARKSTKAKSATTKKNTKAERSTPSRDTDTPDDWTVGIEEVAERFGGDTARRVMRAKWHHTKRKTPTRTPIAALRANAMTTRKADRSAERWRSNDPHPAQGTHRDGDRPRRPPS